MIAVPAVTRRPSLLIDAAHLFALCGFAIAQPLFDLLGKNPTFFVAHDLDGRALVAVAFAVLLIPPLVLLAVLTVIRLASAAAALVARAVMVGLLVAATLLPPLERAIGLSTTAWIALTVVIAIGAAIGYDRLRNLRTFITYLAPAPALFLAIFLFLTPVQTLILSTDPAAAAVDLQGTRTPVIVIVFDEFPLGVLLDDRGAIDATRYPGFTRLADTSTWYPNTTTVSSQTIRAVPAIQTGLLPPEEAVPVASNYPRSLFTLFARSHRLRVSETVTRLCPRALCRNSNAHGLSANSSSTLFADLETVYFRALLPDATATEWGVPTIEDRWAGFGHVTATRRTKDGSEPTLADFDHDALPGVDSLDQAARFETFLASLRTGRSPGLWFHHSLLPHVPYTLFPDGRPYNAHYVPRSSFTRPSDVDLVNVDAQRLVLQTMHVDHLVDQLLDRLKRTGMLDDALVVVTADHGVAFVPEKTRRDTSEARGRDGVLPVPLIVKYPGQVAGEVDRRDARTIDVVPTVVDALGIDLPADWHFDGRSLIGPAPRHRRKLLVDGTTVAEPVRALRIAAELDGFLVSDGGPQDPFRIGPYGELVGEPVASLTLGSPVGSVHANKGSAYDHINLDRVLPALFEATVTGVEPGQWVAVALNGTIAGVGPVYQLENTEDIRIVSMLDPSFMRAQQNTLDVYRIDSAGTTLHPLTAQR
ncbi:MAG: sulfatase-like hydrolase/transferase [Acidimicrobiia bacterium]